MTHSGVTTYEERPPIARQLFGAITALDASLVHVGEFWKSHTHRSRKTKAFSDSGSSVLHWEQMSTADTEEEPDSERRDNFLGKTLPGLCFPEPAYEDTEKDNKRQTITSPAAPFSVQRGSQVFPNRPCDGASSGSRWTSNALGKLEYERKLSDTAAFLDAHPNARRNKFSMVVSEDAFSKSLDASSESDENLFSSLQWVPGSSSLSHEKQFYQNNQPVSSSWGLSKAARNPEAALTFNSVPTCCTYVAEIPSKAVTSCQRAGGRPAARFRVEERRRQIERARQREHWAQATRGIQLDPKYNKRLRSDPVQRWHQYADHWKRDPFLEQRNGKSGSNQATVWLSHGRSLTV